MHTLLMLVSNLHCPSCICHIEDVLGSLQGINKRPDISLISQTIKVSYDEKACSTAKVIESLLAAAFDVQHVTDLDQDGRNAGEYHVSDARRDFASSQHAHRQNCDACQQVKVCLLDTARSNHPLDTSRNALVDEPAIITIDQPSSDEARVFVASISIGGMTCGSCVGTVATALNDLSFVSTSNVDLLGNAATIRFRGKDHVDQILTTIDDLGYEATLVGISEADTNLNVRLQKERTIEFKIDGMHCVRCPQRIVDNIEAFRQSLDDKNSHLRITKSPTIGVPNLQLAYVPSHSKHMTVRDFIFMIESLDPSFRVSVYYAPTLEERSKALQRKERQTILLRLIFTGAVAIPSFILGVVYMALVPVENATRQWLEKPIWAGNASRLEWALFVTTTPVMFFGTDMFHRRAFKEIWAMWKPKSTTPLFRRLCRFGSMNMLISVGTLVAYISSLAVLIMDSTNNHMKVAGGSRMSATYFDAITFLAFFVLIGKYLEAYSKTKTGETVAMLTQLKPKEAHLVEPGGIRCIPVGHLELGDIVQIPQGHSPPADGIVEQNGSFSFNEASLTGESKPVSKIAGDIVFTGTINVADPVRIRITELGGSSMLDQIIDVVRGGQAKRAPVERVADILTGYFVPLVTLTAILTWAVWLSLGLSGRLPSTWLDAPQGGWAFWSLEFAIAVFVIACPCGVGLAAPTALFVGGDLAAKQGILAQGGGQAFQEASSLSTIVFDKTGTLTHGQMRVVEYEHFSEIVERDTCLIISKALENASTHPIAQAITEFCSVDETPLQIANIKEMPGYGMTATVITSVHSQLRTFEAAIGNEKLIDLLNLHTDRVSSSFESNERANQASTQIQQSLHKHRAQGRSVAILAIREQDHFQAVAMFALADPIRPEAFGVVSSLQALDISVHICTGDNDTTAVAVAAQLGIPTDNVRANALPQSKAEYIQHLQNPSDGVRKLIAFVGDGLNDTPALTAADVSISLSSGSDIAINASSFILLNSHLGTIHNLIKLSRRVFNRVKINFFWAAVYNVTLIPVAAGVLFPIGATKDHGGFRLNPVWAAAAMAGSSVSVVVSSLALKLPELKWPWNSR